VRQLHLTAGCIAYEDNGSALVAGEDRLAGSNLCASGLDGEIYATSAGKFHYLLDSIYFLAIDDLGSTEFLGLGETLGLDIYDIDLADTFGLEGEKGNETDATCTEYYGCLSCMCATLVSSVEAYCERLDEGTFHGVNVIGQFETKGSLMGYILLEYAIYRRSGEKDYVLAEIVATVAAVFALSTGLAWLEGYAITYLEMLDVLAYLDHCATGFVTQHERCLDDEVSDASCLIIMEVGTADAYILNLDQYLVICRLGNRSLYNLNFTNARH
jgi:hypothetical protein